MGRQWSSAQHWPGRRRASVLYPSLTLGNWTASTTTQRGDKSRLRNTLLWSSSTLTFQEASRQSFSLARRRGDMMWGGLRPLLTSSSVLRHLSMSIINNSSAGLSWQLVPAYRMLTHLFSASWMVNAWKRTEHIVRIHSFPLASSLNYLPIQDLGVHGWIQCITFKLLCSYTGIQVSVYWFKRWRNSNAQVGFDPQTEIE